MLNIRLICVGKLKEQFYLQAMKEYEKRLGGYCHFEVVELPETRLSDRPSRTEIESAIDKEGDSVIKSLWNGCYLVALCIEGKKMPSEGVAELLNTCALQGKSKICFVIGGSYGLSSRVKQMADLKLSMSDMTFPHHLARVMVAEQIYRGFKILEGSSYHK